MKSLRKRRRSGWITGATLALGVGFLGCGFIGGCAAGAADSNVGGASSTTSSSGSTTQSTTTGTSSSSANSSTSTGFASGGSGGGPQGIPEVFGHSVDTLYKLDPNTKAVSTIGKFTNCEVSGSSTGVMDIALDKDSNLYASSHKGLYLVDKETAACTKIASGDYPNSLSFVPAGTLDPNEEALVGYVVSPDTNNKNQYIRVDTKTGVITKIGGLWTQDEVSSGDIVSVKNGPTYLTLKGGNDCAMYDCLAEVNPQTGKLIKNYGPIDGYQKVFGIAFWAGSTYGFTQAGTLFELKIQGNALITNPISTPSGLVFWGAGSTTSAPPVPQ